MTCVDPAELAEERIDRVLTQYRESPRLIFLLRTYLTKVAETALQVCDLPSQFDIDFAVGDQLTLVGKRLGWPRCHCVCDTAPVFGFDCPDEISIRPVTGFGNRLSNREFGFCDEDTTAGFNEPFKVTWQGCPEPAPDGPECDETSDWAECSTGLSELCLSDDLTYRKFLQVRRYQALGLLDLESLEECLRIFFGPQAAVLHSGQGRVVVAPGRELSNTEVALLQLYPRVLPVALGIEVRFHFGDLRVFGFGSGWGGFCEPEVPTDDIHLRTGKVFGFCDDDLGGFCEPWALDGAPLGTEQETETLTDEQGRELYTGPLYQDATWMCRVGAPWMCETDVRPYDCA